MTWTRSSEFITFVSSVEDRYLNQSKGKEIVTCAKFPNPDELRLFRSGRTSYGSLRFDDKSVYSYNLHIAEVWPHEKVITYNETAIGRSRTTSIHLGAILGSKYTLRTPRRPRVQRMSAAPTSGKWDPRTKSWIVEEVEPLVGGYTFLGVPNEEMYKNPLLLVKERYKLRSNKLVREVLDFSNFLDSAYRNKHDLRDFVKDNIDKKATLDTAFAIAVRAYAKAKAADRAAMRGFLELLFEENQE